MSARHVFIGAVTASLVAGVLPLATPAGPVAATLDNPFEAPTIVADLDATPLDSRTSDVVSVGDTLYARADDQLTGNEGIFEYRAATGALRQIDLSAPTSTELEDETIGRLGAELDGELIFASEGTDPTTSDFLTRLNAVAPGGATREILQLPVDERVVQIAAGADVAYVVIETAIDFDLWTTDGTTAGTSLLVSAVGEVEEILVYERPDGTETLALISANPDDEVTRIDPSTMPSPTVTRYDVNGPGSSSPRDLVAAQGVLYFLATDSTRNLYSVGGNAAPTSATLERADVDWLRATDTHLYVAEAGNSLPPTASGEQLVRLDAADTSTRGLALDAADGQFLAPGPALTGTLLFVIIQSDGVGGSSSNWWEVTGMQAPTELSGDGAPLSAGFSPAGLANADRSAALLGVDDGDDQLWRFVPGSALTELAPVGEWEGLTQQLDDDEIFTFDDDGWAFLAESSIFGEEPHITDGTGAGTSVVDVGPGTKSSSPSPFFTDGDEFQFRARTPDDSQAAFVYDAATDSVEAIDADRPSGVTRHGPVVERGGDRYFVGRDGDVRLFRTSNGTTSVVSTIVDGDTRDSAVVFTDDLVFVGDTDRDGTLWVATLDGSATLDGGVAVLDLGVEVRGILVGFGGGVVFQADLGTVGGQEPWFSDGTLVGTQQLGDTSAGLTRLGGEWLEFGGRLYFSSFGDLWVTDGTQAGTGAAPVSLGGAPLAATDTALLTFDEPSGFVVVRGEPAVGTPVDVSAIPAGTAVAVDDTTSAGEGDTFFLSIELDGVPTLGVIENDVLRLVSVGATADDRFGPIVVRRGVAYFALNTDLDESPGLWRSDGTVAGTGIIHEQPTTNSISLLDIVDDRLVAALDDPLLGRELFSLDVGPGTPSAPTDVVAAVTGGGELTVSWSAPASDGGTSIVAYAVSVSPGGAMCSTTGATSCVITGLTDGSYTVTVTASNESKTSAPSASAAVTLEPDVVSLAPRRFLESRAGEVTFDGEGQLGRRVAAGETVRVQITGRGGIAAGTSGVVANVTAVFPSAPGFVTVWDCVGDPPTASSLNYGPGSVVPNELVAKLSASGELCLFSLAETDLLVDVAGLVPAESALVSLAPRRFFESRAGESTFDTQGRPGRRVAAGETVRVQITGRGGIAAGTAGVVANVTAVFPSAPGFVTVWDCAGDPPTASSLNYGPGSVVPNELVAKLSASGELCLFSLAETDLLVDVVGLVPSGSDLVSLSPARYFESRAGEATFDGAGQLGRRVAAGETVRVDVAGRGDVPAGATGVVVNVTAVFPSGPGFVTVWDCVGDPPTASSLNYGPGQVVPNELVAKLSASGELCLFTLAETDLLVDVVGAIT